MLQTGNMILIKTAQWFALATRMNTWFLLIFGIQLVFDERRYDCIDEVEWFHSFEPNGLFGLWQSDLWFFVAKKSVKPSIWLELTQSSGPKSL